MSKVSRLPTASNDSGGWPNLMVVGFSARALAEAVLHLGCRPAVIDHFSDHDCQLAAQDTLRLPAWGQHAAGQSQVLADILNWLVDRQQHTGPLQILLGGGTENWPQLIGLLHDRFEVLGPSVAQLRKLRDWEFWQTIATSAQVGFPETVACTLDNPIARTGGLYKPIAGSGGSGIRRAGPEFSARPPAEAPASPPAQASREQLWQREILGRSLGAYCVVFDDHTRLLGITQALTAADWAGPSEFVYRGSLGPVPLPSEQHRRILAVCDEVRRFTHVRGWLQFDFIEDADGQLWLLEINPRWTAGMEILLLAGLNPVRDHLSAWGYDFPRQIQRGHTPCTNLGGTVRGQTPHLPSEGNRIAPEGGECWGQTPYANSSGIRVNPEGGAWGPTPPGIWGQTPFASSGGEDRGQSPGDGGQTPGGDLVGVSDSKMGGRGQAGVKAVKAVWYADGPIQLTEGLLGKLHAVPREVLADIPSTSMMGQTVEAGQPLMTLRTTAARLEDLVPALHSLRSQLQRQLGI